MPAKNRNKTRQVKTLMAAVARNLASMFDKGPSALNDDEAAFALRALTALTECVETVRRGRNVRKVQP